MDIQAPGYRATPCSSAQGSSDHAHTDADARDTGGSGPRGVDAAGYRPVQRIGHALVVIPSLGPSRRVWKKLGFRIGRVFDYHGLAAFDVPLEACGLRFLAAPVDGGRGALAAAVYERLEAGAGLLGWTWMCQSVFRTRRAIEEHMGIRFSNGESPAARAVVPGRLTPAATTIVEPLGYEEVPHHRNSVCAVDHLVFEVSDADRVADAYEQGFGLHARRVSMKARRYAFLKVGGTRAAVIELVGPEPAAAGPLRGRGWGLAFRSRDIDATESFLRERKIPHTGPRPAVQGGHILSLPTSLGGVALAVLGE